MGAGANAAGRGGTSPTQSAADKGYRAATVTPSAAGAADAYNSIHRSSLGAWAERAEPGTTLPDVLAAAYPAVLRETLRRHPEETEEAEAQPPVATARSGEWEGDGQLEEESRRPLQQVTAPTAGPKGLQKAEGEGPHVGESALSDLSCELAELEHEAELLASMAESEREGLPMWLEEGVRELEEMEAVSHGALPFQRNHKSQWLSLHQAADRNSSLAVGWAQEHPQLVADAIMQRASSRESLLRQREMEQEAEEAAKQLFQQEQAELWSIGLGVQGGVGKALLGRWFRPLQDAIREEQDRLRQVESRAASKHAAQQRQLETQQPLLLLDAGLLAVLTLHRTIDLTLSEQARAATRDRGSHSMGVGPRGTGRRGGPKLETEAGRRSFVKTTVLANAIGRAVEMEARGKEYTAEAL